MIKGVNKQVVEINETGNEYFEKAIFFVRPEYSRMGEGRLREKAKNAIDKASSPPKRKGKGTVRSLSNTLKLLAAAVGGGTITALILLLAK
ncbi:MAG: hypothetical protein BWY46_01313 [Firmicutes bacterium ADurb.Bin300]|jgi:hypothetical protein|nr:MAG: hypothetical protein BWY46_01313 [Firmicutes bacterium ADurb.Bin300]